MLRLRPNYPAAQFSGYWWPFVSSSSSSSASASGSVQAVTGMAQCQGPQPTTSYPTPARPAPDCGGRDCSPWWRRDRALKVSVFSNLIGQSPTMFCSHWLDLDYSIAPPALLCHKEPAQGTQNSLLGAFLAFRWFHAQKGSIICALLS